MRAAEIYEQLDKIRALVDENVDPDGMVDIDERIAGVVLEFALVQIKKSLEQRKGAAITHKH